MFEYYNNTLCVKGKWLDESGIVSFSNLRQLESRNKIKKAQTGGGLGGYVWYIYSSMPERFRVTIEHDLGINPYEQYSYINFSDSLKFDQSVAAYFSNYELEDGRFLSEASPEVTNEYIANYNVLNAINIVVSKVITANPRINKSDLWERISKSVHNMDSELRKRYPFDLPTNPRILRAKYESCILEIPSERYPRTGLEGLIHDNWCNNHSIKITKEVGDYLIAYYALPVKYSIPELLAIYEKNRSITGFPKLSESGILNFLMKPEIERIWLQPRDGKEAYINRFGHSIKRNKEVLFPNAHWAIDGSKLDAIHYMDNTSKMAAEMNYDIIKDVFSEKIIGWSFSESETHVDHFKALRMAVNTAGARPYLFTYDAQSGHKSKKMQELYSRIIANGGTHYHHKVGRKSNPIEQMFDRFQKQVVNKRWFSDKQSIKSKRSSSKVNTDFIKEFKGALPTKEELYKHFILMVNEWNNMKHPRFNMTRNEVYAIQTEHRQELDPLDQISMFWLSETKPKLYKKEGMKLTVAGVDYDFEVYDKDNQIDLEFRREYVNTKLIVCYDPEYLDQYIKLYKINDKGQKVFVAYAQKKREHSQIPKFTTVEEKAQALRDIQARDEEMMRDWDSYQRIAEITGITREKLIDEQNESIHNNWELEMKLVAYATKPEQIKTNRIIKIM